MSRPAGPPDDPFASLRSAIQRQAGPRRPRAGLVVIVILGILALMTFGRGYVLVGAGERAVIFNRIGGTRQYQFEEGLRVIWPWVDIPTVYNVQTQTYTMSDNPADATRSSGGRSGSITALSSDGLPVSLEVAVLYRIDEGNVWRLHQEIGPDYVEKIIRPTARSVVRAVLARHPVTEIYSGARGQIVTEINERLRSSFARSYIVLDEALVKDIKFSQRFQEAIEQKQVAQQEVQRMRYVLDETDKQRQQKIIQAEGEAESIRLKAKALSENPQLVEWEYVQKLPEKVSTIVTDGRTILNMGDGSRGAAAAAATR